MVDDALGCVDRNPTSFAHFCKVKKYKGGRSNGAAVIAFYQMHMSRATKGDNPPQIVDKSNAWASRVRGSFGG